MKQNQKDYEFKAILGYMASSMLPKLPKVKICKFVRNPQLSQEITSVKICCIEKLWIYWVKRCVCEYMSVNHFYKLPWECLQIMVLYMVMLVLLFASPISHFFQGICIKSIQIQTKDPKTTKHVHFKENNIIFIVDKPNQIVSLPPRKGGPFLWELQPRDPFPLAISCHASHWRRCNVLSGGERGDRKCYKAKRNSVSWKSHLFAALQDESEKALERETERDQSRPQGIRRHFQYSPVSPASFAPPSAAWVVQEEKVIWYWLRHIKIRNHQNMFAVPRITRSFREQIDVSIISRVSCPVPSITPHDGDFCIIILGWEIEAPGN